MSLTSPFLLPAYYMVALAVIVFAFANDNDYHLMIVYLHKSIYSQESCNAEQSLIGEIV